jgi:anti-sigma factor RsiW
VPATDCASDWAIAEIEVPYLNCQEAQVLLHAYVDLELGLSECLQIEQHLRDCPVCAQSHDHLLALRSSIQRSGVYLQAPPALSKRVGASLQAALNPNRTRRARMRTLFAIAASLALVLAGWELVRLRLPGSEDAFLTRELVASHVRSQMLPTHRFDVASSDAHTVKPWFEGKLDFSPPVKDLTDQGFPLLGGRLDYVQSRPVAVLLYQRRKHFINLFIWPALAGGQTALKESTRQGFHLLEWTSAEMTFWAVSDLNAAELQEFARLIQG